MITKVSFILNGTLFIETKDKNYLSRLKLMFWTNFNKLDFCVDYCDYRHTAVFPLLILENIYKYFKDDERNVLSKAILDKISSAFKDEWVKYITHPFQKQTKAVNHQIDEDEIPF